MDIIRIALICRIHGFMRFNFHVPKNMFVNFVFSYPMYYKYALPSFLIYSFDNDEMKSLKCHATLLTLIFLLKYPMFH